MKVLGLIDTEVDVVSKKYVDDKIASIPTGSGESGESGESEAVKNKARVDLMMQLTLIDFVVNNNAQGFKQAVSDLFNGACDKNGTPLRDKYDLSTLNRATILNIAVKERVVYVDTSLFLTWMD